jgi:hypothetical protein
MAKAERRMAEGLKGRIKRVFLKFNGEKREGGGRRCNESYEERSRGGEVQGVGFKRAGTEGRTMEDLWVR